MYWGWEMEFRSETSKAGGKFLDVQHKKQEPDPRKPLRVDRRQFKYSIYVNTPSKNKTRPDLKFLLKFLKVAISDFISWFMAMIAPALSLDQSPVATGPLVHRSVVVVENKVKAQLITYSLQCAVYLLSQSSEAALMPRREELPKNPTSYMYHPQRP